MRVIAKRTLRLFWEQPGYDDAERPLTEWYHLVSKASWQTPQQLKAELRNASILKSGRVVFNIAGNKYRLVAAIRFDLQLVWVKFVGTHAQYDLIDAETVA
jgi:mRNA interferase HigB